MLSCSVSISQQAAEPLKFAWSKGSRPLISAPRLSIETLPDYSLLRLVDLKASDSGHYTCAASDAHNQEDKTTAQVTVNGEFRFQLIGTAAKEARPS